MSQLRLGVVALLCSAALAAILWRPPLSAQGAGPSPVVAQSLRNDVSPPLADVPAVRPEVSPAPLRRARPSADQGPGDSVASTEVVQDWQGPTAMPGPIVSFDGVRNSVGGPVPPDTNGDVGPNHYVQWVNVSLAIWDKSGNLLYGPAAGNSLWAGFGGACETTNDGDPIVLYDRLADRWLMSQFALPNFPDGPFYQCLAVSQTADPTGRWYRYAFLVSTTKMNDYPKFGVWPDGYYMSVNQFAAGSDAWAGAGVFAFERATMLKGSPARMIYFDLASVNRNYSGLLPAHLVGLNSPPQGAPNYFAAVDDSVFGFPTDGFHVWRFRVDWSNPAASSFTGPAELPTAAFDSNLCDYVINCLPQLGSSQTLDALSYQAMYRLVYRNFGNHDTLLVNQTVNAGTSSSPRAGIRWYEVRDPGGTPFIYQQGTFAPDASHRWMGSAAMDASGNIAIGYSATGSDLYPSIRYVGRLVMDTVGTLPRAEVTLMAGGGSQTGSGRWGDYSSMSVDPVDDCTFWYTSEYYPTTAERRWSTRIGSFRFPSCAASPRPYRVQLDPVFKRD